MKIIKIKKQVGVTSCNRFCSYFSGTNMPHNCGKPIYEEFYRCSKCKEDFINESAAKIHQSKKHINIKSTK